MSAARPEVLRRLLQLRDLRLRAAERDLAEARAEVDRRAAALAVCEAEVAAVAADQAALDGWFERAPDPRHFETALHRRDALGRCRAAAEAEVASAEAALADARAAHAQALAAMHRARARRDAAQARVADHRRSVRVREERAAEEDGDERAAARPFRGLARMGATA